MWRYTQVQLRVVTQHWQRDYKELLNRALVTLEEANHAHQEELKLQKDHKHQQDICQQLRKKVCAWNCHTLNLKVSFLRYTSMPPATFNNSLIHSLLLSHILLDWTELSTAFSLCCFPMCNLSWWEMSSRPDQQWWLAAFLCVCIYSRSPDEAEHNTRLSDSISSFSCHLGWAVNTNKLIRAALQTWWCCLGGVLVHIRTSYLLTIHWVVDIVMYKRNWFCLSLYFLKNDWNLVWILPNKCVNELKWSPQNC